MEAAIALWAGSGAMALTRCGKTQPSIAPAPLAAAMGDWATALESATSTWGSRVRVDGPALLGERAAIHGFVGCNCRGSGGHVSVGGGAKFVRVADGWLALNLARREDVESLPALVGAHISADDWPAVSAAMNQIESRELIERGSLLGMALAGLHEPTTGPAVAAFGEGIGRRIDARPLVIDLSSLWAGPLATSLMVRAGARVVKVESVSRPDGARLGHRDFFDLLNGGKRCVSVDFSDPEDVGFLRCLLESADLVVESSRPRALRQIGIIAEDFVAAGVSWLSVTAHGRDLHGGMRVGFGDDAAVAGGLWVGGDSPMFVADAVADPLTGLRAGVEAARMLASGRSCGVAVSLSGVAASVPMLDPRAVGADVVERVGSRCAIPMARAVEARAGAVGAHNALFRNGGRLVPGALSKW